jgi:hypothetical protein
MSFQAYLDNIEAKTGKTPDEIIQEAKANGLISESKTSEIVTWLKEVHMLGHGHAMALAHVIKHGPQITDKHVGSSGSHRDETDTLRLDGIKKR